MVKINERNIDINKEFEKKEECKKNIKLLKKIDTPKN
jgi:hypothetical protein